MNEEFKNQEGINLVDEYSEISTKFKELKKKQEELKGKLIEFARENEKELISGTLMNAKFKKIESIILPEDKMGLIKLMKEKGIYEDYSMLSYSRINSKYLKGEIEETIKNTLEIKKDIKLSLSKK